MHCTLIMYKVDDKSEYAQNVYFAIFQFDFECTWWEKDSPCKPSFSYIFTNPSDPDRILIILIDTSKILK